MAVGREAKDSANRLQVASYKQYFFDLDCHSMWLAIHSLVMALWRFMVKIDANRKSGKAIRE